MFNEPPARHGTPELMPWSHLVADGITMLKDGSFIRSYRVYGADLKAAELGTLLSVKHHGNAAFAKLGDGWMIQTDLVRRYVADYIGSGPLPDPVTQLIENQRERHWRTDGTHLETAIVISLTYRPPSERENWIRRLFFTEPVPDYERDFQHFISTTDALAADLRGAELQLEPMNSDEALSFYESCIIGEQVRIRAPKIPNYLDTLLGRHRLEVSRKLTIGGRALRVVVPTGFPHESLPEIVDFLCKQPFPYRYHTRAILLGTQRAGQVINDVRKQHIQKKRRKWDFLTEVGGMESNPQYLNEHAVEMSFDATTAAAEAESNVVREVYFSFGVVITDPDPKRADEMAEAMREQFSHHQFEARVEISGAVEAWRGTLPGDGFSNLRKPVVNTMNLADLTPTQTTWTGDIYNPNSMYPKKSPPLFVAATEGLTPFRFHMHVSDVGSGVILGPVGGGKSTLGNYMAAQSFKIPEMQTFVFDKGRSFYVLTKACGGEHWDLGNDHIKAAPLIDIDQQGEREWAHDYIAALLRLALNRNLFPEEDDALWRALQLLAGRQRRFRTMTGLTGTIQNQVLKQALMRYTLEGRMGRYLDADEDELLTSDFITFELEDLKNSEALLPVLLYLFHRIERRTNGRPTTVLLDEAAWVILTNDVFGKKVDDWERDFRKKKGVLWLLSQSLDDLAHSPQRSVILQACPTRIFLPDPDAQAPHTMKIYEDFDLKPPQIEIIAQELVPKRNYLVISPKGVAAIDLELDPTTLAFCGAGSQEDIQRVRELIAKYGECWQAAWLRERGLPGSARELERLTMMSEPQYAAAAD